MPIVQQCTDAIDLVFFDLISLERTVVTIEKQWEFLRDDPRRRSPFKLHQDAYIKLLHEWYAIDLPRDRAALVECIRGFWEHGSGLAWEKLAAELAPKLVGATLRQLKPGIDRCNTLWEGLEARCLAAGEAWDQLVQLELKGGRYVYFTGERLGPLRRLPDGKPHD